MNDFRIEKLVRQFYFFCKEKGHVPVYCSEFLKENSELFETNSLDTLKTREENAEIAKLTELRIREEEHEHYFGNFVCRCEDAKVRFEAAELEKNLAKQNELHELLLLIAAKEEGGQI
mmetsp:Transcript_4860/g.6990  ORF Transcript_4860/g.6990 Transcript_4860/m.6990 type:complete len:118 (+) Transcript_4860:65-418(+)